MLFIRSTARANEKNVENKPVILDSVIFHSLSVFPANPATSAPKLHTFQHFLDKEKAYNFNMNEKSENVCKIKINCEKTETSVT